MIDFSNLPIFCGIYEPKVPKKTFLLGLEPILAPKYFIGQDSTLYPKIEARLFISALSSTHLEYKELLLKLIFKPNES